MKKTNKICDLTRVSVLALDNFEKCTEGNGESESPEKRSINKYLFVMIFT